MNQTMKQFRSHAIAAALCMLCLSLLAPAVRATTVTECMGMIDSLYALTDGTHFLGQNAAKDESGLLGKLLEAKMKLNQAKFPDAIGKLTDYRNKVMSLASQRKINTDPAEGTTAEDLVKGADAAIQCIRDLCRC